MLSRLNVVRLKMIRFRPLSGSYISQWNVKSIIKFYIIQSFRPLSGSYISQYIKENAEVHQFAAVSVPYRGATFLNNDKKDVAKRFCIRFPSPIGELHFSIEFKANVNEELMFPSPIGELHFSIMMKEILTEEKVKQFPSPIGELHFSIGHGCSGWKSDYNVSVPYRGATFLNKKIYSG